ncbi:calcium-binding protein [Psychromonas hadalis]|uniref:calcium-binding protein n=1 Tax=Psychromonas hadalis TaxID=211669 RepID=UPI000404F97B|nr:type I secretion C-terminal target domain-containing protein [Psychromonas hadalis]
MATGNVLDNTSNVDGSSSVTEFTVDNQTVNAGETVTIANVGTLSIAVNGAYTFTPLENYNGNMPQASYTVQNDTDTADTDSSTLDVKVLPITDAISDDNEQVSTLEDTDKSGNVLNNVIDTDSNSHSVTTFSVAGDAIIYTAGQTANTPAGTITIAANGDYTFDPADNFVGNMPQVSYALVDNNDALDTDTSTLDIAVTAVDDAPLAESSSITLDEDVTYVYKQADFNFTDEEGDSLSAIRIETLPIMGDLYYDGIIITESGSEINVAYIGLLTFKADPDDSGSDDYSDSGVGEQKTDYANFAFSVKTNTEWSEASATTSIDVKAIADAPTLSVTTEETVIQEINIFNVADTSSGFKIEAFSSVGVESTISTHRHPQGFGVLGGAFGGAAGADAEIGGSELLVVTFDNEIYSAEVAFAWKHSREDATYTFYKDGNEVGSGTILGGNDGIDPVVTLQPENGAAFDQIVFSAPGKGDDYLIHSITYDKVEIVEVTEAIVIDEESSVALNITSGLTDTDGSEVLDLVLEDIPVGFTLTDGTHSFTADASTTSIDITNWSLNNLTLQTINILATTTYTLNVVATSTENSNADSSSTSSAFDITVNNIAVLENDLTAEVGAESIVNVDLTSTGTIIYSENGQSSGEITEIKYVDGTTITQMGDHYLYTSGGQGIGVGTGGEKRIEEGDELSVNLPNYLTDLGLIFKNSSGEVVKFTIYNSDGTTTIKTYDINDIPNSNHNIVLSNDKPFNEFSFVVAAAGSGKNNGLTLLGLTTIGIVQTSYSYPIELAYSLIVTDGSESVTLISLGGFPDGTNAHIFDTSNDSFVELEGNGDGTWTIDSASFTDTGSDFSLTDLVVQTDTPLAEGFDPSLTLTVFDGTDSYVSILGGSELKVLVGSDGNDLINGESGDDRIIGGLGEDILIGGDGVDTFVWLEGDTGIDHVKDFNFAEVNGDVLDLSDLLNLSAGDNLDNLLDFRGEGEDTIITVHADGGTQTIVLDGVNLGSDDVTIINDMLTGDHKGALFIGDNVSVDADTMIITIPDDHSSML